MLRSIGWLTFVVALAVAAHISQHQPFDQSARNIAAYSDRKVELLEQSMQTIDESKLESLRDLSRLGKSRIGERE